MADRKSTLRLVFICFILSFSTSFEFAFNMTYTNSAVDSFRDFINESFRVGEDQWIDEAEYSSFWNVLINVWFVGFLVGIWISRAITDKFGRKDALITGNFMNVFGAVLRFISIMFSSPILLLASRLLCSIGTSVAFCAIILFLNEVPPKEIRGSISVVNQFSFFVIAMLTIIVGNDALLGRNLPMLMGIAMIPSIASFFVFFRLPETPNFLVHEGQLTKAERSVDFYRAGFFHSSQAEVKTIESEISFAKSLSENSSFLDLFREKHLRGAMWIACCALLNTISGWSVLLNSTYFLENSRIDHELAQIFGIVVGFAMVMGNVVLFFIVDRFGRRPLLLWTTLIVEISFVLYVVFDVLAYHVAEGFKYGCIVALTIYGFTFCLATMPMSRFVGPELVPQQYKSLLSAFTLTVFSAFSFFVNFAFLPLYSVIGSSTFLVLYAIPSVFFTIYIYLYLPEANGRNITDIVATLKSGKRINTHKVFSERL